MPIVPYYRHDLKALPALVSDILFSVTEKLYSFVFQNRDGFRIYNRLRGENESKDILEYQT